DIGLKTLRNKNKIKQAFTQAGFFVDPDKIKVLNVQ
ncbi:MAG: ribosomal protein L23, partial [Colwellia sp.]